MALTFERDEKLNFVVMEVTHSATETFYKLVRYTPDLSQLQVNNDPWRDTTPTSREWFEKHYRHHFE